MLFIPLVETIAQSGFNVKSLVALGAATFSFSKDVVNAIISVMTFAGNAVVNAIYEPLRPLIEPALSILGIIGDKMNQTIEAIMSKDLNRVGVLLSEKISELTQGVSSNLANVSGKGVEQIINVWGTKDILLQTGIGGKRLNLAGVADTVNIEIVGAEHGDYMKRGNENPQDLEDAWNRTVSKFVADLIINSDTVDKRKRYFDRISTEDSSGGVKVAQFDLARGVWVIKLFGWEYNQ